MIKKRYSLILRGYIYEDGFGKGFFKPGRFYLFLRMKQVRDKHEIIYENINSQIFQSVSSDSL